MKKGCFFDVSERAIVSLTGPESLDLLQRISTNDVAKLNENEAVQTVLTNEKGRIVEVVSVLRQGRETLLVMCQSTYPLIIKEWIEKYIIMENIIVTILSDQFIHLILYDLTEDMMDISRSLTLAGCLMFDEVLASTHLRHVLTATEARETVVRRLKEAGLEEDEKHGFEEYRVVHGIPDSRNELSSIYNPLEAGLVDLVSFTKGCYIGQEVIARLDSYKKVQRELVRLKMSEIPAELPEKIYFSGQEWGSITSAVRLGKSQECRGIGYVKSGSDRHIDGLYFRQGANEIGLTVDLSSSVGT